MPQLEPCTTEPLYLIRVRHPDAEARLRTWGQDNRLRVDVEGPRMRLYSPNDLSRFRLTWPHDWAQVTIWDCWNKRHVDLP